MAGTRALEQVKGTVDVSHHCPDHITPSELSEVLRQRQREEQEARILMP